MTADFASLARVRQHDWSSILAVRRNRTQYKVAQLLTLDVVWTIPAV